MFIEKLAGNIKAVDNVNEDMLRSMIDRFDKTQSNMDDLRIFAKTFRVISLKYDNLT